MRCLLEDVQPITVGYIPHARLEMIDFLPYDHSSGGQAEGLALGRLIIKGVARALPEVCRERQRTVTGG